MLPFVPFSYAGMTITLMFRTERYGLAILFTSSTLSFKMLLVDSVYVRTKVFFSVSVKWRSWRFGIGFGTGVGAYGHSRSVKRKPYWSLI